MQQIAEATEKGVEEIDTRNAQSGMLVQKKKKNEQTGKQANKTH